MSKYESKLTINLVVSNALNAMEYYERVFDASRGDIYQFENRIGENETNIIVGGVSLRLVDENSNYECFPPKAGEVDSLWLQIVVEDIEKVLEKALHHGGTLIQEVSEFLGVRNAILLDPFGYTWTINQILYEVSYEERLEYFKKLQEEISNN